MGLITEIKGWSGRKKIIITTLLTVAIVAAACYLTKRMCTPDTFNYVLPISSCLGASIIFGVVLTVKNWTKVAKVIVSIVFAAVICGTLYYCVPRTMSDAEIEKYATEYSQKVFDAELAANKAKSEAQKLEESLATATEEEQATIKEEIANLEAMAQGHYKRYAEYHDKYNELGAKLIEKNKDSLRERFYRKYKTLVETAKANGTWCEFIEKAKEGDSSYYATEEVTLSPEQEAALQAKVDEFAKRYNEAKAAGKNDEAQQIAIEMTAYAEQYSGPEQNKYYELIATPLQEM